MPLTSVWQCPVVGTKQEIPMANPNAQRPATSTWTSKQAYILAVICLLLGGAFGYLLRGSSSSDSNPAAETSAPASMPSAAGPQQPTPEQMAQMARKQASLWWRN